MELLQGTLLIMFSYFTTFIIQLERITEVRTSVISMVVTAMPVARGVPVDLAFLWPSFDTHFLPPPPPLLKWIRRRWRADQSEHSGLTGGGAGAPTSRLGKRVNTHTIQRCCMGNQEFSKLTLVSQSAPLTDLYCACARWSAILDNSVRQPN